MFDLMRERGERPQSTTPQQDAGTRPPAPAPAPAPRTAHQPAPKPEGGNAPQPAPVAHPERPTAWDTSGGVSRAERSAAAMLDEEPQSESRITLSVAKFYTLVALALVLIVGAWAGGYQIGFGDGKDEMAQFIPDQPIVNPQSSLQANPASTNPRTPAAENDPVAPTQQPRTTPPGSEPTSSPVGPRAATDIMIPGGFRPDDPRTAGLNYLALATLSTEQATDAIAFLRDNGVTVIGVPVLDSRRNSANNPSRYALYSLGLAIPGNQWSAMSNQRLDHQQLIANLGARWQQERRGGSDFSQTNWEKYDP